MVQLIKEHFPEVQVIAGTATAGIPHAAWIAQLMDLPMCYVRAEAKSHGKQNQIEGIIRPKDKVVVIEDLISTGKSSLAAADAIMKHGGQVLGVVAIFTYNFKQATTMFMERNIPYKTLTDFSTLITTAQKKGSLPKMTWINLRNGIWLNRTSTNLSLQSLNY